jgi:transcription initiation factor TFIID subunit 5
LKFSACGRYLASGGADGLIIIWDISTSAMIAQFASHKEPVYALEFSRDNSVLASGSLDNTVKLWNMSKLTKEVEQIEDFNKFVTKTESQYEIGSWMTKQTPIMHLHFTRRNLIVGIGSFISS